MALKANLRSNLPIIGLLIALMYIQHYVARHDSTWLIAVYAVAFSCYLIICSHHHNWQKILVWGIIIRITFLWFPPTLSDDFYRFFWDGQLSNLNINPYLHTPKWLIEQSSQSIKQLLDFYPSLNSPSYYSVYPPVAQSVFWCASTFGSSIELFIAIFRLFQLAADIAIFFLIREFLNKNNERASLSALYFLNPLVILELTGNLHLEGIMLLFILLSVKYYDQKKIFLSGGMLGLSIATKLIPIVFLPAIFIKSNFKNFSFFVLGCLIFILFTSVPFWDISLLNGIKDSSTLFINKFEFNASIYFLFKAYGYWDRGFNTIATSGPTLTYITIGGILTLSFFRSKSNQLPKIYIEILLIYLTFALVVHPWYIIPLIGLSPLTNYRFPILWSFLIVFSYIGYFDGFYEHPYIFILVEYFLLWAYIVFELYYHFKNESTINQTSPSANHAL